VHSAYVLEAGASVERDSKSNAGCNGDIGVAMCRNKGSDCWACRAKGEAEECSTFLDEKEFDPDALGCV
jgi:hypothetical protein